MDLANALIPQIRLQTSDRIRFVNVEGLAIVLRRLAFPSRWEDLSVEFGRHYSTIQLLDARWSHLLDFNPDHFNGQLRNWADAIATRGSPRIINIVAFLDGTLRKTCRPHPNPASLPPHITQYMLQRVQYNGHKRHHGFKYQSVTAPNGLVIGTTDGRFHW